MSKQNEVVAQTKKREFRTTADRIEVILRSWFEGQEILSFYAAPNKIAHSDRSSNSTTIL